MKMTSAATACTSVPSTPAPTMAPRSSTMVAARYPSVAAYWRPISFLCPRVKLTPNQPGYRAGARCGYVVNYRSRQVGHLSESRIQLLKSSTV